MPRGVYKRTKLVWNKGLEDLFIELNYHQSHGPHPYNPNNSDDKALVEF